MKWIEAFLCGRTQRVVLNGLMSSLKPVLSGVPQGSALGPLLFVVYINDLQDVLSVFSKMYADDTKLLNSTTDNNCCLKIQESLTMLANGQRHGY